MGVTLKGTYSFSLSCDHEHMVEISKVMLKWAIILGIVALIAGALGFSGVAGAAAGIAKVLFFLFLAVVAVLLILGFFAGKKVTGD